MHMIAMPVYTDCQIEQYPLFFLKDEAFEASPVQIEKDLDYSHLFRLFRFGYPPVSQKGLRIIYRRVASTDQ